MKKTYIQPAVQVAQIALASIVLAGSGYMHINTDVPTDDPW